MSIIYQAQNKTSSNKGRFINSTTTSHAAKTFPWFDIALWLLIVVLLVYISMAYFPKFKKHWVKPTVVSTIASPQIVRMNEAEYQSKHKLTGVFLSEQEKIALINNHYYHLGDTLDGMQIVRIELNRVLLRNNNQKLILSQQTA